MSYTGAVANASTFGCFTKILYKWRGSVYKLIYKELLAYISCYFIINLTYRMIIVPHSECFCDLSPSVNVTSVLLGVTGDTSCCRWKAHRELFEQLRVYCQTQLFTSHLTFVLGFYISLIIKRWWHQYQLLPWPDSFGMLVTGLWAAGPERRGRLVRRNIIRYITLSYCIALRTVSFRLKKRFPTMEHLVHAGIMREDELEHFSRLETKTTANKWFLPLVWAGNMVGDATEKGEILAPVAAVVMAEVVKVRGQLQQLLSYDWVSVPLVYTQTVTLAVYFYFIAALFAAQWVTPASNTSTRLDLFFPFFVTLQFAFYVGWLKVAETLINPFGEDDDDFELNRLLDRHLQVGYMICDPTVEKPDLLKDRFWDEIIPQDLLYSVGSEGYGKELEPEFRGSAEVALEDKLDTEETGYGYSEGVPRRRRRSSIPDDEMWKRRRRRSSVQTVYESIRTQGKISRQTSETGLMKTVLTKNHSRAMLQEPPATPPRPKGGIYGAGFRAGIASLASRGSRSKMQDAKQESCDYSDADMKEAYRIS